MQTTDLERVSCRRWPSCNPPSAKMGWCAAALLLLIVVALPIHAQYGASLQGTVTDPMGAVVPGATITLVDKETNRTVTAVSGDAGLFTFNQLAPSSYTITVSRDGFKKKVLDNVAILAEQANSLNVKLDVGTAAETVTVNAAETPVIDTETGSISGTISQNDLAKMPDFGRDPLQLAQLAPGMFGDASQSAGGGTNGLPGNQGPGGSGNSSGPYSTENRAQVFGNGGRNDTNGVTIDGVQATSVTWGSAAVVTPNPDTIKEMKVVANPYDATLGRFSGAQIQIISQNGTDEYHGTGLFKLDRPGLNAHQRWDPNNNPQRDNAKYNEFGGTVGGPILRHRIFFFFGYDTIRNTGTVTGGGWYDTPALDGESSSGTIANKFVTIKGANVVYKNILEGPSDHHQCADIGLVQNVNCNWIQGQGLDLGKPLSIGVGKHDPSYANPVTTSSGTVYTPGLGGDGTGSYAANMDGKADMFYVSTVGPNNNINTQYNGRLDYQVTSKDMVAGSIYYVPVNNTSYNGPQRASNIFYHNALNYSTGLLYNRVLSNTMLNEARADMAGWKWNELGDNPQSPLGLPNDFIALNNGVSFSNVNPQQFGPSIGSIFDQWTLNFKDVVSKVYKSHNLKFGGQYTRLAYLDSATWAASSNFYFNNYWDFLNDAPQTESISGADPLTGIPTMSRKDDRQYIPSFFVQDDWKIRPNLTLNLGVRWEYFAGMTEKKGNNPRLNLGSGSALFTNLAIALNQPQVDAQKTNFGPQFGFAWSPTRHSGKLVVRGGLGVGFNGLEEAITTNTRFDPPFLTNSNTLSGSQIVYGTGSNIYKYGTLPANPALKSSFNSANLPNSGGTVNLTGIDNKLPTSYAVRYSLEAQYDLGNQWVATLGYSGSAGRHLPLQYNLYNKYAPQIYTGQYAFNPIVNFIDWYEDTGTSAFNSMLAEVRHQFAHTFEADVQYRWAHSLDNGSGPYTESDYQFLPGYNWGSSDFDSRNSIKMFGVWSPILFHGNTWAEKLAGGWTLSPIFNFHSGFPFNPFYGGIACNAFYPNSGNCNLRPAKYTGGASRSERTDSFKTSAAHFPSGGTAYFTAPAVVNNPGSWNNAVAPTPTAIPGAPGLGRNAFAGPRYSDIDLAATKAFGLPNMRVLGENARLEIRANVFNLFNKLNLFNPDANIPDANFGRANNALGSRTIEGEFHFKF